LADSKFVASSGHEISLEGITKPAMIVTFPSEDADDPWPTPPVSLRYEDWKALQEFFVRSKISDEQIIALKPIMLKLVMPFTTEGKETDTDHNRAARIVLGDFGLRKDEARVVLAVLKAWADIK
jgi:hypothetical protein